MNNNEIHVFVSDPTTYGARKRCIWLGHQFYRCGNCKKRAVKVFKMDDHDKACEECKWRVVVSREGEQGG